MRNRPPVSKKPVQGTVERNPKSCLLLITIMQPKIFFGQKNKNLHFIKNLHGTSEKIVIPVMKENCIFFFFCMQNKIIEIGSAPFKTCFNVKNGSQLKINFVIQWSSWRMSPYPHNLTLLSCSNVQVYKDTKKRERILTKTCP